MSEIRITLRVSEHSNYSETSKHEVTIVEINESSVDLITEVHAGGRLQAISKSLQAQILEVVKSGMDDFMKDVVRQIHERNEETGATWLQSVATEDDIPA